MCGLVARVNITEYCGISLNFTEYRQQRQVLVGLRLDVADNRQQMPGKFRRRPQNVSGPAYSHDVVCPADVSASGVAEKITLKFA